MSLPHIQNNDSSFTVIIDNRPVKFDASHPSYIGLVECVEASDEAEFKKLMDTGSIIEDWSSHEFEYRDGELYFEGEQVPPEPVERIVKCLKGGFSAAPTLNYCRRVFSNVSNRALTEGFKWLQHKGIAITDEGMVVGYKGVKAYSGGEDHCFDDLMGNSIKNGDLVDIYTGKSFRNNIGDKPSMKRRKVCDDHTQGCAAGLHVGTYDYACNWAGSGGVVVLVQFDPKDIVSVPSDSGFRKIRVSEYEVMQIAREEIEESVVESFENDEDDWDELEEQDGYDDWSL